MEDKQSSSFSGAHVELRWPWCGRSFSLEHARSPERWRATTAYNVPPHRTRHQRYVRYPVQCRKFATDVANQSIINHALPKGYAPAWQHILIVYKWLLCFSVASEVSECSRQVFFYVKHKISCRTLKWIPANMEYVALSSNGSYNKLIHVCLPFKSQPSIRCGKCVQLECSSAKLCATGSAYRSRNCTNIISARSFWSCTFAQIYNHI